MAHPSEVRDAVDPLADDDFGRIIRWGLQDSFAGAQPPDNLWPNIRLQVQEARAPARRTAAKRRPAFSFAPLLQAVVVSALLLVFGLGIGRDLTAPRGEQVPRSTPTAPRVVTSQERPDDDMLRGYLLFHREQQPSLRPRPGGAQP